MKCKNCGGMAFVEDFTVNGKKVGSWCLPCRIAGLITLEVVYGSTGMSDVQREQVRVCFDESGAIR
jgi:hypothetical protein